MRRRRGYEGRCVVSASFHSEACGAGERPNPHSDQDQVTEHLNHHEYPRALGHGDEIAEADGREVSREENAAGSCLHIT